MRALILGSSNGFFKGGYVQAVADHPAISEAVNISLGASPAVMAPYRLRNIDLSGFDLFFLETLINDAASIALNTYSQEDLSDLLNCIVRQSAAVGTAPISVLIPGAFLHPTVAEIVRLHKSAFDGFVLDMVTVMQRAAQPIAPLMHDASHVHPAFSYPVMRRFLDSVLPTIKGRVPRLVPSADYAYVPVSGPKPVSITTAAVTDTAFRFDQGQSWTVDLPEGSSVVALVFNQSNTRTILQIEGSVSVLKDVRFDVDAPGGPKMIVSAMKAMAASPLGVRFEVTRPQGVERSYFVKDDRIEIAGMIVRSGDAPSIVRDPADDIWVASEEDIRSIMADFKIPVPAA